MTGNCMLLKLDSTNSKNQWLLPSEHFELNVNLQTGNFYSIIHKRTAPQWLYIVCKKYMILDNDKKVCLMCTQTKDIIICFLLYN